MILEILLSIFGIIAIVVTVVIKLRMNKDVKKLAIKPNAPKIEIEAMSKTAFTGGYRTGAVKSQIPCKNGCTRIEMYPDDVEQGENVERPPLKAFIVKNEFLSRFAEGESGSSRRQIIKVLPRSKNDMPSKMRETEYGKFLEIAGQKAHLESTFGKLVPNGDVAIAEAMKEFSRGELTKPALAQVREINEEYRKAIAKLGVQPTDQSQHPPQDQNLNQRF